MSVQYRELGAPTVGFDLSGQNIGYPTSLNAEEIQRKVPVTSVPDVLSSLAHICCTGRLTLASVQVKASKRYKDLHCGPVTQQYQAGSAALPLNAFG